MRHRGLNTGYRRLIEQQCRPRYGPLLLSEPRDTNCAHFVPLLAIVYPVLVRIAALKGDKIFVSGRHQAGYVMYNLFFVWPIVMRSWAVLGKK